MQVGFKIVPVTLLAANDQIVGQIFLQSFSQVFGHKFKMMQSFVLNTTLGVATIVDGEAVATAAVRLWSRQMLLLRDVIHPHLVSTIFEAISTHRTGPW